ncbi:FAD-dependent oxidoreductase [Salegentibacter maritimus]|uniref:FAD-dependent oxidoreductase n=1 Tax=Salegentibacter maritimus TaxID=2794347 RepID=UPI0018E43EC9|nr:FAD-dependent oxidoreductase [Salegentibacter maritimus]MBI6117596.1 FAD-dependent oxidoreductase [Salegentibacter maritimus]
MIDKKNISKESFDIIICGGGPSGSMAAIAAAREGSNVLLIEQYAFLGGTLTAMGVGPMMTFHNNVGEQVVKGYPDELIERLKTKGASPGHIEDVITYCSTITPFDSEALKIELEDMVTEAGGTILYHTMLVDVVVEDGKVKSIIAANKNGLVEYRADFFIDSTGDGDLAKMAGLTFKSGRDTDGLMQPLTMNLKVANVDREKVKKYARKYPERCLFDYGKEEGLRRLETAPRISLKGYIPELKEARKRGEVSVPREFVLLFETGTLGVFILNMSRIQGLDGTDPYELSQAEMIGRKQCVEIFNFLKNYCEGFENCVRMDTSAQVGVRETRRIDGHYTITEEDIISASIPEDTIALGGYPIDIHSPDKVETNSVFFKKGTVYGVPLRSLVPKGISNLLINGRCIDATHEALAAIRVTPQLMAVGQGAGTVAHLCVNQNKSPLDIDIKELRLKLQEKGALIDVPKRFFMFSEDFGKDEVLDDQNQFIFSESNSEEDK